MMRAAAIAVIIAGVVTVMPLSAPAANIFGFPRTKIRVDGRPFTVLVADTQPRREQGLSFTEAAELKRRGVDGMLFVFDGADERTFQAWYMKFDLVLLGLDQREKNNFSVIQRKVLRIGTTERVRGRYVLEVPVVNNTMLGN